MLDAARDGDREAYAELFRRHSGAAVRFGVRLTGDVSAAHDLVSEAFVKLMRQLDRGTGPDGRPLAYLMATMRNLHVDQYRRHGREVPTAEVVETLPQIHASDESDRLVEGAVVAKAFAHLPENYRTVLWHTEVLGRPLSEVADVIGTNRNAVGVLAFRAREALREAYLAEHLGTVTDEVCRTQVRLIPKYVRGNLAEKKRRQLEQHLPTCASCAAALHNVRRMNTDLSVLILPALALGGARFSAAGAASSSGTSAPASWIRVGVVGTGLGLVAVAVFAVSATDDPQPTSGLPEEPRTTVVPQPSASASAGTPEAARSPSPTPEPTLVPTPVPTTPAATASPIAPSTPTPSPQPTVPTVPPPPSPTPPPTRLTAPYVTVARSSDGAALRLLSRITGLTRGTAITLAATNVTAPDTVQLEGWRCTQVQPRPTTLRLTCRATRSATSLYSVGLSFVDPAAALTGTIGLGDRSQTLSFVATA